MERMKHWPVSVFAGLSVGTFDAIGPFSKAAVKLLSVSKCQLALHELLWVQAM